MKNLGIIALLLVFCFTLFAGENQTEKSALVDSTQIAKITFLELGSKTCIPCQQMEKVMESISEKYGDQINVIFHDVRKDKKVAVKYKIKMIPTQVFLDETGNEIHRHVGFYPEKQIDEFLQKQGMKIIPDQKEQ